MMRVQGPIVWKRVKFNRGLGEKLNSFINKHVQTF